LVLLLVLTGARRCGELRAVKGYVVPPMIAAVCGAAAVGLQFMAFQVMFVGLVEVIKRVIGLVSAVLVGHLVFQEAMTVQQLGASGMMAVGIALVLL
jgi:hypothetical protein